MKTIVAIGLVALVMLVVVAQWKAFHPPAVAASASESQIYIHGTPVCVFRHGESIVATVGECGTFAAPRGEGQEDRAPDSGGPGLALPPGHPPVGPDMLPEGGRRRILI